MSAFAPFNSVAIGRLSPLAIRVAARLDREPYPTASSSIVGDEFPGGPVGPGKREAVDRAVESIRAAFGTRNIIWTKRSGARGHMVLMEAWPSFKRIIAERLAKADEKFDAVQAAKNISEICQESA